MVERFVRAFGRIRVGLCSALVVLGLAGLTGLATASSLTYAPAPRTWFVAAGTASPHQELQGLEFYPGILVVDAGDRVTWVEKTQEPHTVTFLTPGHPLPPGDPAPVGGHVYNGTATVSSGMMVRAGQTYTLTFPKPGYYFYVCEIHPGMAGLVIVQPAGTPYPETQAQYDRQGRKQEKADLAQMNRLWHVFHYQVTSNPDGTRTYHLAAGLAPAPATRVALTSRSKSAARGVATLQMVPPGNLLVAVSVTGLAPGSRHAAEVRLGTCTDRGPVAFPLHGLVADTRGDAAATTVIPHALGIAAAGWFVGVQPGTAVGGKDTVPTVCGDVHGPSVTDLRFAPKVLAIHVGDTVVWTNPASNEVHTVTFLAPGQTAPDPTSPEGVKPAGGRVYGGTGYFNSGWMFPGQSYTLTFTQAGTYTYVCLLHDDLGMVGKVIVLPRSPTGGSLDEVTRPRGIYRVTLQIGSMEPMWTPAQAKGKTFGEVMAALPGTSSMGMSMGMNRTFAGHPVNRHLEVHVYNATTGTVIADVLPRITLANEATGQVQPVTPVVAMYGVREGKRDWHYGNNVYLNGTYTVTVTLGSEKAVFLHVTVRSGAQQK